MKKKSRKKETNNSKIFGIIGIILAVYAIIAEVFIYGGSVYNVNYIIPLTILVVILSFTKEKPKKTLSIITLILIVIWVIEFFVIAKIEENGREKIRNANWKNIQEYNP